MKSKDQGVLWEILFPRMSQRLTKWLSKYEINKDNDANVNMNWRPKPYTKYYRQTRKA